MTKTGLMAGKRGVIMGVANDHSLAWGVAQALAAQGAELAFTYQGEALLKRVAPLASELGSDFMIECDVSKEGDIEKAFNTVADKWGKFDFVVHAIAFADKNELKGHYRDTSRSNFLNSMNISCYSFTETCREAAKHMNSGGAFITLTYYGAEKVVPHYNVMGVAKAALEASVRYLAVDLGADNIRVNAISAGPVKTLAAAGIGDFRYILKWNQFNSPLRRNTSLEDVGGAGVYLLSDLSAGVTGEVHHVDSGYHVVGMKAIDAPDLSVEQN
ncbi:enoyl-ACP reductase FabI [Candidatus Odyssella thessalonicensis]|uniref:enoyl-ACP reductase FabI n=1 Tax=Candidatus Odyssella thessalonicensis TaxID=84647 RepID=UPI000225AF64|nr:enoyl-ACP reductase FabI [Candidatus Odyssella thessalonicensis]